MKNLLNLDGVTVLGKKQQETIFGGKSKLYCAYHSTTIKVFGWVIHDSHTTYAACRAQ